MRADMDHSSTIAARRLWLTQSRRCKGEYSSIKYPGLVLYNHQSSALSFPLSIHTCQSRKTSHSLLSIMLLNTLLLSAVAFGTSAHAAAAAYAQCGGQGFTGDTTCVSGYTCVVSNAYYSQCLPGSNTAKPVTSTTKTSAAPVSTSKATGGGGSSGTTYKASFTQYGSGDTFGSGNCNTDTTACGFYTNVRCLSIFFSNTSIEYR